MPISVRIIVAIVIWASASAEEPPATGLRRAPHTASDNDGDAHLRTRASGGKPIAGASIGRARGLRKRKNRGKAGKGGGGSKSGKGGGGAKSGKGGAKSGKSAGGGGGGLPGSGGPVCYTEGCEGLCHPSPLVNCDRESGCCRYLTRE